MENTKFTATKTSTDFITAVQFCLRSIQERIFQAIPKMNLPDQEFSSMRNPLCFTVDSDLNSFCVVPCFHCDTGGMCFQIDRRCYFNAWCTIFYQFEMLRRNTDQIYAAVQSSVEGKVCLLWIDIVIFVIVARCLNIIAPNLYYNLSQDEVINGDHQRTLKLNDAKLLQIAKQQIFPKWSIIAEGVFREQADQLVTIEGSKMMSSSTAVAESFDRHFCTGKVSNGYISEDWSVDDLANELRQEKSSQKGKTCWDEVRVTGITQIGSLNGARTLMGQELRNCSDDDDVSKDDFLGNNHQKNEDKRRLPDLEDDKSGDGFANIVTCVNRAGASGDYDYVTFGLAVYGFDITPVAAENLKYVEAADETFPDGESALMLVCARLRHVASSSWGSKRYLNMDHLNSMILSEEESIIAG